MSVLISKYVDVRDFVLNLTGLNKEVPAELKIHYAEMMGIQRK